MSTAYLLPRQLRVGLTALADKWGQSSLMAKTELPVVGITAPTLVVLAAWLGIALGLPLTWNLAAVTILGLACVSPFMLRRMLSSTLIETDVIPFTARTNRAGDVLSYYAEADYEGLSGPMGNSLSDLTGPQLELMIELLDEYLEKADLGQTAWAETKSAIVLLDDRLAELDD